MSVSIPEPAAEGEWLDLGQRVFPDWHAAGLKQYQGAGWTLQALYDYRKNADPNWPGHEQQTIDFWADELAPSLKPQQPATTHLSSPFATQHSTDVSTNLAAAVETLSDEAMSGPPSPVSSVDEAQSPSSTKAEEADVPAVEEEVDESELTLDQRRQRRRATVAAQAEQDNEGADDIRKRARRRRKTRVRPKKETPLSFSTPPPGTGGQSGKGQLDSNEPESESGGDVQKKARRYIPSVRIPVPRKQRPPVDKDTELWVQVDGRDGKSGPRYFSKVSSEHVQWQRPHGNVVIIQSSMCRRSLGDDEDPAPVSAFDDGLLSDPPGNLAF